LSFEEGIVIDVHYVDKANLGLDFLILLRTIRKLIGADGISLNEKFRGV
jgi:lipopolysaccharide/colanic/teichoic acid biosynthesis glycosyltransferase